MDNTSAEKKDILKVSKHNQNIGNKLSDDIKALGTMMDADIEENEQFLSDMDCLLGIDTSKIQAVEQPIKVENVDFRSFEELAVEASSAIPYDVTISDILTSEEIISARKHVDEIYTEFKKRTRLNKIDLIFLGTAIALQCVRQYVLDPWLRNNRKKAGINDEKGRKENVEPGWYRVQTDKILINRVPFDAQKYSGNPTVAGFLKGGNHRFVTLGHDPILGWVFGTMNILTNTITRAPDFATAHIKQQGGENVIHSLADIFRVFEASANRLLQEGVDGKIAVGSALLREGIHLKSDINTKKSLPIPIISIVSPKLAEQLSRYGIDIASVGTEISLSIAINFVISMVHRLFYDESVDDLKQYEVRTRKILLYSNTISTVSNVITSYIKKEPKTLDIGGIIVTISRLFSDIGFILRVEQEFVESQLDVIFRGTIDEVEKMYSLKFGLEKES